MSADDWLFLTMCILVPIHLVFRVLYWRGKRRLLRARLGLEET